MATNSERKSIDKKRLDFAFAINGLPLVGSGGARIVVTLANTLQNKGYNIGIISLARKPWLKVLNKEVEIPWIQRILLKLNDSPLTYKFFNPLFRFCLNSPSHFKINRKVKIFTITNLKNYDCRIYIATNFINANQLKLIGIPLGKIILFSQIDETNSLYSGKYSDLALETYKSFSKRLFINQDVINRFPGSQKINMAIDLSLYRLTNPIDLRIPCNVVFITRNGEQKDPATAITAMYKIKAANPGAHISAYGNLNKNDLPDFVNYHHNPSNKEVVSILNSNSIFVTTSVLEGYPLPPLEAMACGCAVVSTDSVGVREYLLNEVNGILCPVSNADLIANYVLQLMSEDSKRMEIARRGYETAMKHSYDAMIDNFLKIASEFSK